MTLTERLEYRRKYGAFDPDKLDAALEEPDEPEGVFVEDPNNFLTLRKEGDVDNKVEGIPKPGVFR